MEGIDLSKACDVEGMGRVGRGENRVDGFADVELGRGGRWTEILRPGNDDVDANDALGTDSARVCFDSAAAPPRPRSLSAKARFRSSRLPFRSGSKSKSPSSTSTCSTKGARSAELRTTDSDGEMRTMRECG